MALLPILEAPHPILSKKARPVAENEFGAELVQLLNDMAETMYDAPGVGLAAPQIGDSRRILVADPSNNDDHDAPTLFKMVNPTIINKSAALISYEESCLSVPEFYLNVKRFEELTVEWQDGMGTTHRDVFSGFAAIVLQHEMDHLDGVTYSTKAVNSSVLDTFLELRNSVKGTKMKVVFMGTPDFAVPTLNAIVDAGHEVLCVVAQPDKPKGRGKSWFLHPPSSKLVSWVYRPNSLVLYDVAICGMDEDLWSRCCRGHCLWTHFGFGSTRSTTTGLY